MEERLAYVQTVRDLRCFLQHMPRPDTADKAQMADCLQRLATLLKKEVEQNR